MAARVEQQIIWLQIPVNVTEIVHRFDREHCFLLVGKEGKSWERKEKKKRKVMRKCSLARPDRGTES